MRKFSLFALIMTLSLSLSATADIYKIVDKNGNVTYTDKLPADPENVTVVKLRSITEIPAPEPRATPPKAEQKDQKPQADTGYQSIQVVSPRHEETIPHSQQHIILEVSLSPGLKKGHRVQTIIDGQSWGDPVPAIRFTLTEMNRGEHSVEFEIYDADGNLVGNSNSVTFFVQRTSLLGPNNVTPFGQQGVNTAPKSPFSISAPAAPK